MRTPFIFLLATLVIYSTTHAQLPTGFVQTKVAEGLNPTRMAVSDDGRIFIAEKHGVIRVVQNGALLPAPLITIGVDNIDERGLQSIVLDPDFGTNQYFYVYYAVPGGNHNRVSRFRASGNFADINSELILMEFDGLWWQVHNGGGMVFGPDNKLYIACGDGARSVDAQNLGSTLGKVMRINSDGTIPTDNPFYNLTTGKYRAIYAIGVRNPFQMAIHRGTGDIIFGDVGNNSYEEINILKAGKNYGWPLVEGPLQDEQTPPDNYEDPLYAYDHSEGCAIVSIMYYSPDLYTFPEQYHNKILFGDYCNSSIKVIDPDTGLVIETFASNVEQPIGLSNSPDGSLYYFIRGTQLGGQDGNTSSSNNGSLWKVTYTGTGIPFIFLQPQTTLLSAGETAGFSVAASGSAPLSYQWMKDGVDIDGAVDSLLTLENVLTADNGALISCKVINSEGEVVSEDAILQVTSNTRPSVTISVPLEDQFYKAGDTISFKGIVTDLEDGILPSSSMTWKIDFHHNEHSHPALSPTSNMDSSALIVPVFGETASTVWFRIYLTVVDNGGLTKTVYKDIHPLLSSLTLQTDPPGLSVNLDGQPTATPAVFDGTVNLLRSFYAPPVQYDGNNLYIFKRWNNETTENPLTINTPDDDSVFTAHYFQLPLGDGTGLKAEFFNQYKTFEAPADLVRIDPNLDFHWDVSSPAPGTIDINEYTIRWTGYIKVPFDEEYTFSLLSDDGSRLWVNDTLVIDNWAFNDFIVGSQKSGSITLQSGKYYRLKVEYYESMALSFIKLFWSSNSIPKSIVPSNQFFIINPDNETPEVSIISPDENFRFNASDSITVNALVTDDEALDPNAFIWRINIHHDEHVHTLLPISSGSTLKFLHDEDPTVTNIWYRVYLSYTDRDGETASDSVDIFPRVTQLTLKSKPANLNIKYNGNTLQLPRTISAIAGTSHILQASNHVSVNDTTLTFIAWNKVTQNPLTLSFPDRDTTITVRYGIPPVVNLSVGNGRSKFAIEQELTIESEAYDVIEGELDQSSLQWEVYIHSSPTDSILVFQSGGTGILKFLPDENILTSTEMWYRVYLVATNAEGSSTVRFIDIFPNIVEAEITSNLEGVQYMFDNRSMTPPFKMNVIEGSAHLLNAPAEIEMDNDTFVFVRWGNELKENEAVFRAKTDTLIQGIYNAVPKIAFSNTDDNFTFSNNSKITVGVSASDREMGTLTGENVKWNIDVYVSGVASPYLTGLQGAEIQFVTLNETTTLDIFYRIHVTATDDEGSSKSISKDIHPKIVKVSLEANIPGVEISLDDEKYPVASSIERISGSTYSLNAPFEFIHNETSYIFIKWQGENPERTFEFTVPLQDTTLTALYEIITGAPDTPEFGMEVYPQPAHDYLIIKPGAAIKRGIKYELSNSIGQIHASGVIERSTAVLEMRLYPPGFYFLKVFDNTTSRTIKVIKQ